MTLPSPGSPNFFPALLEHARAELGDPDVRSIHPGVFSTLLLDRIVGGGGVIIDVEAASGSIGETSSGVAVSLARVGEHIKSVSTLVSYPEPPDSELDCRKRLWYTLPCDTSITLYTRVRSRISIATHYRSEMAT